MSTETGGPGAAVVLGAAGGIGRACAARLAGGGARVVAVDRDEAVRGLPHCVPVVGDATDGDVLARAYDAAGGAPAVLVHALLGEARAPLAELTADALRSVLDTGLVSAWQAGAELVRRRAGRPGAIVLIGSVHAHGAAPGMGAYAVAKAGLAALARAAAAEWGPLGVRCNVVEPGFVAVGRNAHRWQDAGERARILTAYPLGRLCGPEEVAEAVAFLAGPGASYVNGACVPVDGGPAAGDAGAVGDGSGNGEREARGGQPRLPCGGMSSSNHRIPEGVGRTALAVAHARMLESHRPDRLFDDPYAAAFVEAAGQGRERPGGDAPSPGLVQILHHLVVRTRFFDDFVRRAAADGCRQVVLPAAGLDTRAYRLDWPAGTVCYEIDMPEVLAFKERVLAERAAVPRARRTALAADLRRPGWTAALTDAGFDPARPSAWLVEGLLVYLEAADAARLLERAGALAAPGSRLALTHGLGAGDTSPHGRAATVPEMASVFALWKGGLPEDPVDWLARRGWRAAWHDRAEAAMAYGRPAGYVSAKRSFVTAERQ
ncbi:SAM-dependent methyltransferase [Streptomyces luteireticuli]|uniref:SAM-dependent methyltransferase n=1 Tax=Streptomyces luteireticuli TaxID=173858 RepID=UPI003556C67F